MCRYVAQLLSSSSELVFSLCPMMKRSASGAPPKSTSHAKKPQKSQAEVDSEAEIVSSPQEKSTELKVYWEKNPTRTECLIAWLKEHPVERQKLFSDSAQDAKQENRSQRKAKGAKSGLYMQLADSVFSVDNNPKVHEDFKVNPAKYAKSVKNHLGMYVNCLSSC